MNYQNYFNALTGIATPHPWQCDLASTKDCEDRLIRIPTGFGKTLGVLSAWAYNRILRADERWPRRLVWCLPMRVLVEQTYNEICKCLERVGLLWNGEDRSGKVGVHQVMGGSDAGDWHLHPECCAVLVGTQDMLLSRALNRGYGAARAHWPLEFGLLNQDCLWVMDEVQLMDVGLATSGQLQSFRIADESVTQAARPCRTWWMSATLQRAWLRISPDTRAMASELPAVAIAPDARKGPLWQGVHKPVHVERLTGAGAIARRAGQAHAEAGFGRNGPTLVVLNRVEDAVEVFSALSRDTSLRDTDMRLVHSRFRQSERDTWRDDFLNQKACTPGTNRIIVATQVIEAGVDISAAVLITHIAPWPSLVQRFGRCARWGGSARVIVADFEPKDDKSAAPYEKDALDSARQALSRLTDVSPLHLEAFEETNPDLLPTLYPYAPKHLLLRHEFDELFDTTPDLSGADIDVSRFIRSGEERDLQVFWQDVPQDDPDPRLRPLRAALCAVPAHLALDWLCNEKSQHLRNGMRAWVWEYLEGKWRTAKRRDLYPGRTVLVACECGGYDPAIGWTPKSGPVHPIPAGSASKEEQADASQDDESLSVFGWQTIAFHGSTVGSEAASLADMLDPAHRYLLDLAGRWHDVGKAHEAFSGSIRQSYPGKPQRHDLAKAPDGAWLPPHQLYPDKNGKRRRGFRHELASTLALFAVLERHNPQHPALLGPWHELLRAAGFSREAPPPSDEAPNTLEQEILALSAEDFDLLAYLVCSHHGKLRFSWHASPADQQDADDVLRIRGVCDGDVLPSVSLATSTREFITLPASVISLDAAAAGLNPVTGRGWTERTIGLLRRHGPFLLAYLEALLRVADQRASQRLLTDPLLSTEEQAPTSQAALEQESAA